jgi:L-alanine-DL-glutamate epimerase-like enolase superfamily enzyme
MKIADIALTQEKIKLKVPFITALREVHFAEFIRIKVICDDGSFAYGEAPATKAITGETLSTITQSIQELRPLLSGQSLQEAFSTLHQASCGSSAKAAVDMALVQLQVIEQKSSLKEYFGIADVSPLQTDITISLGSVESMLREAKAAYRDGMTLLKVKFGSDIAHAITTTQQLTKELPEATLLIDANQAWSEEATLHYLTALDAKHNIALIEQPVGAKELAALKRITAKSSVPILADEALFSLEDAQEIVAMQAADMFNIKVMKCGGITKAMEILEYARSKNVKCMLGSMIEGPYSINMTLYLAFAYRDVISYIDLDSPLLYEALPREMDFVYEGATISFKAQ